MHFGFNSVLDFFWGGVQTLTNLIIKNGVTSVGVLTAQLWRCVCLCKREWVVHDGYSGNVEVKSELHGSGWEWG